MLRAGEIAAPRQAGKSRALAAGAGPAAKRTVPAPGLRARTTGAAMSSGRRLLGLPLAKYQQPPSAPRSMAQLRSTAPSPSTAPARSLPATAVSSCWSSGARPALPRRHRHVPRQHSAQPDGKRRTPSCSRCSPARTSLRRTVAAHCSPATTSTQGAAPNSSPFGCFLLSTTIGFLTTRAIQLARQEQNTKPEQNRAKPEQKQSIDWLVKSYQRRGGSRGIRRAGKT
jgi:hypothetical protein